MQQQAELDFTNLVHTKENNKSSEEILFDNYERLSNNCKILYSALLRGEKLTGQSIVFKYGMLEYRRRIKDLKAAGVEIKEAILFGGCKQWWIEK